MTNFPTKLIPVIEAIQKASVKQNIKAYLFGSPVHYLITEKNAYSRDKNIEIALICSDIFNVSSFYETLVNFIEINREIENSSNRYYVLAKPYILDFKIYYNSNIEQIQSKKSTGLFYNDSIAYDISEEKIIDPKNTIDNNILKPKKDIENFSPSEIFSLITALGQGYEINKEHIIKLSTLRLKNITEPVEGYEKIVLKMLLSQEPGTCLDFIKRTFPDSDVWLFRNVINSALSLNVALPEAIKPEEVFSNKRFELINAYSDFYLNHTGEVETEEERRERLSAVMRLLFDSPNIDVATPYIDNVSVLSAEMENSAEEISDMETVRLFAVPPGCEYGQCPPCDPVECLNQGKSPCCCCDSSNIISEVQFRCHKGVVLSCNEDATTPGPNEDPFPAECPECLDACETILGLNDRSQYNCDDLIDVGLSEGWWELPLQFSPCECECKQGDPDNCELTCVTCAGLFCQSEVTVSGGDCSYRMDLTPANGCCGTPAVVDWMFVIDYSGSMGPYIDNVKSQIDTLIDNFEDRGATIRLGLTTFGQDDNNGAAKLYDFGGGASFTSDKSTFISALDSFTTSGGAFEPDIESVAYAATQADWGFASGNYIMLICDELTQPDPLTLNLDDVVDALNFQNITVYVVDNISPQRLLLATNTNGSRFDIGTPFSDVANNIDINVFPTSCDCIDSTPIPLRQGFEECKCCQDDIIDPCVDDPTDFDCLDNLPEHCYNIPVKKCLLGTDCNEDPQFCSLPNALNACGQTVLVIPQESNLVCCSDLGLGCDCEIPSIRDCCGPDCPGMEVCDQNGNPLYDTLKEAQDAVWCECFAISSMRDDTCTDCCCPDPEAGRGDPNYPCDQLDPNDPLLDEDPPRCCPCATSNRDGCCNCCLKFNDGLGGYTYTRCRQDVDAEVFEVWQTCGIEEPTGPDGPIEDDEEFTVCEEDDCIVGVPSGPLDENRCGDSGSGCINIRHPAVTILNNGIGLVAYESGESVTKIQIQQFKSSSLNKILPNREFNFGRLENESKWSGNVAKLYYYDDLPQHILTTGSSVDISDPSTWGDRIAFRTGPLETQVFPLVGSPVYGSNSTGNYLTFRVPTDVIVKDFPSSDDVYNVKWFILDKEDDGLIGDSTDESTSGKDYIIEDNEIVSEALLFDSHIYNGSPVPVAYPSIASTINYSNALENSHFVYLTYQALEDNKWNIYLRQIRLSEYQKDEQIDDQISQSNLQSLSDLGIDRVIYRVICVNDICTPTSNNYSASRSVVFEVILEDGREVFNEGLTGIWGNICPGQPETNFPKEKVFVSFRHTVTVDSCPDQFGFDDIFYNWQVGNEFLVPTSINDANALFNLISIASDDSSVNLGEFEQFIGGVTITGSQVNGTWYDNPEETTWSAIGSIAFEALSNFKGFDISEPILITPNETLHCTRPVVKVNHNNDVFIVYECSEEGISETGNVIAGDVQQIKIIGTAFPSNVLPIGIVQAKQIDDTLNYFLDFSDFIYSENITEIGEGINQNPDIFIDLNDVIHITWQSNRDGRWEIYYTNTEDNILDGSDNYNPVRVTNFEGKSLQPTIDGDNFGRIYIAWHDNRFGNWEIMMSHVVNELTLPLYQQDPYLASIINDLSHSTGVIPLNITNNTDGTVCFSDIKVNFYSDRLLENFVLDVSQSEYPFAFTVPNVDNDETTETFSDFNSWTCQFAEDEYCDPYCHTFVCTSPEYDSELPKSVIQQFVSNITDLGFGEVIEISFRGSETEDDPNASLQWTDWALLSSGTTIYASLDLDSVTGRYKQTRIRVTTDVPIEPGTVSDLINIQNTEDDAFFHFTIEVVSSWKQNTNTLAVRASNGLTGERRIVLRFPIEAPEDISDIQYASVNLTASTSASGTLPVQIGLLDIDNASTLTWTSSGSPSSLPDIVNSINWTIPAVVSGGTYTTTDISSLIQSFVDRSGYSPGNYVGLEIKWNESSFSGDAERTFYSNENGSNEPNLEIEYINEPAGNDDGYLSYEPEVKTWTQGTNTLILSSGIDDPNSIESITRIYIKLPIVDIAGEIFGSTLSLTHAAASTGSLSCDIYLLDYDDASSLDFTGGGFDVDNLPTRTEYKVSFTLGGTSVGGVANISLVNLVTQFTNRAGYVAGNYAGFEIIPTSTTNNTLTFYSNESGSDGPNISSYISPQVDTNIDNGVLSDGSWNYSSTPPFLKYLRVGNDIGLGISVSATYLRIPINVLSGNTISSASLRLSGIDVTGYSGPVTVRITLLDFDDMSSQDWTITGSASQSGEYGGVFDPTAPPAQTAFYVDFSSFSSNGSMAADITTLVQEFINRGGYSPGNYIGLSVEKLSGIRVIWHSYSSSTLDKPKITIQYSSLGTGGNDDDGYLYDPKDEPQWFQGSETLRVSKDSLSQSILLRFPVALLSSNTNASSVNLKMISDSEVFGTLHTNIYVLDLEDASNEDWTSDGFDASNLPDRLDSINWNIESTTVGSSHSVNILSLIQSFYSRSDYDIGNWIGLEIAWSGNTSSTSTYKSFLSAEIGTDNVLEDFPVMQISLDIDTPSSTDDAWIDDVIIATPTWNQFTNNLTVSKNYAGNDELSNILLRFPVILNNLTEVQSATLTLTSSLVSNGTFGIKAYLLDIADASTQNWDNNFNASNRPSRTGTSVSFEVGATTVGQTITITGIEDLIEAFRNRSDYIAGNYIGIEIAWDGITQTDTDTRSFQSYESSIISSGTGPYLTINTLVSLPLDIYWPVNSLAITSSSLFRFCLSPNESITAELDLTPFTRVDKNGNVVEYTALPIPLPKNITHFISVDVLNDDGEFISMPDQNQSVSCFECSDNASEWNKESCSVNIQIPNDEDTIQFMNIQVTFYFDKEKQKKVKDFDAFPGYSDLNCFTVENNVAAQSQWTSYGLQVKPGQYANLLLWPNLDPTVGLQCGINYYVDVKYCMNGGEVCSEDNLELWETFKWKCNCESIRWDGRYEDSPVNYASVIRWRSSGFGQSDIRLTETINNNINPVIKIRSFGQGIVMYSTDRPDNGDSDNYKIFASAFQIVPQANMYASGAQNINSAFSQIIHRSDIPVCKNDGNCYGSNGDRIENSGLLGFNPALEMDQFDNIFLAFEEPVSQVKENDSTDCQEFINNKSRIVKIHRCGLDPSELFKAVEQKESIPPCKSDSIVNQLFLTNYEPVFNSIVSKIRVLDKYVFSHITRDNAISPVVKQCAIEFEIVGSPEAVAVRLRNGRSGDWSNWHPFDPEVGQNTIIVKHRLSSGNGIKFVDFQVATVAGLATTGSTSIIADFDSVDYKIKFYKSIQGLESPDGSIIDTEKTKELIIQEGIWEDSNILNMNSNIPVASIRSPEVSDNVIIIQSSDYIYVEIIPDPEYMKQFSDISDEDKESGEADVAPRFDVISQGDDLFSLPTIWNRVDGIELFRGVFVITEENKTTSKDGLATIITHFVNDCSDSTVDSSISSEYSRNRYNIPVPGIIEEGAEIVDPFASERDSLGKIKSEIALRPSEDPYLIFGDPNYRLNNE